MKEGIITFEFHYDEEIVDIPPIRLSAVQLQEICHQLRLSLILETKNDHQDEGAAQEEQREGPREVGEKEQDAGEEQHCVRPEEQAVEQV
jgi:hypothetical protein